MENPTPCPCGSEKTYAVCCRPYHQQLNAPTAEALMRSRYSAFALGLDEYLIKTRHPSFRDKDSGSDLKDALQRQQWVGLTILETLEGSEQDNEGQVRFSAHFIENGRPGVLTENSRFKREQGRWYYVDGEAQLQSGAVKLGRNEPCWCGSGKKFKKCHGA